MGRMSGVVKPRTRADQAKERRREKVKLAKKRQEREKELAAEIQLANVEVSALKKSLVSAEHDLPLYVAVGTCQVVMKCVQLCTRRAGVVEARKSLASLLEMLDRSEDPAAAGFAAFVADVLILRKAKLAQSKPLGDDIADRFSQRRTETLSLGIGLGVVDDLITIATGLKANMASVNILDLYKDLDGKSKDFMDEFAKLKVEVEGESERGDSSDDDWFKIPAERDVDAVVLERLRRKPTNRKRKTQEGEGPMLDPFPPS